MISGYRSKRFIGDFQVLRFHPKSQADQTVSASNVRIQKRKRFAGLQRFEPQIYLA